MNTTNNSSNITSTGIAVALAVIVALGLILFGSKIFSYFDAPKLTQATTTDSQVTSAGDTQPLSTSTTTSNLQTMNDSNTAAQAGIPANVTQLMIKDITLGTGDTAKAGDTVTVNYVGMLTNGTVFDASANHGTTGFTFPLGAGQVIKGWDEGVAGMKVGGKRELVIPASLGYGAQAVGSIPANSTLIFKVELLKIGK